MIAPAIVFHLLSEFLRQIYYVFSATDHLCGLYEVRNLPHFVFDAFPRKKNTNKYSTQKSHGVQIRTSELLPLFLNTCILLQKSSWDCDMLKINRGGHTNKILSCKQSNTFIIQLTYRRAQQLSISTWHIAQAIVHKAIATFRKYITKLIVLKFWFYNENWKFHFKDQQTYEIFLCRLLHKHHQPRSKQHCHHEPVSRNFHL